MADLNKPTEESQDKPQLELVNSGDTTKEELVEGLSEDKLECPYPNHEGYVKVRNTLSPKEQKEMKENIRITDDGKIEIIPLKKKFSMLIAENDHSGIDMFKWNRVDKNGHAVTYLTGYAAEDECKKQGKKPLKNYSEVEQFINFFPGGLPRIKMLNFIKLFGLEVAEHWYPYNRGWCLAGSIGYVGLSKVVTGNNRLGTIYYGVEWSNDNAILYHCNHELLSPFVAYESLD